MVLFKRSPRLVWSPMPDQDIVSPDAQAQHPALAEDLKTLGDELLPHFCELNAYALQYHNEFRRDQLMLISAGALAAVLGVLHASRGVPSFSTALPAYNGLYAFERQAKVYGDAANALLRARADSPE